MGCESIEVIYRIFTNTPAGQIGAACEGCDVQETWTAGPSVHLNQDQSSASGFSPLTDLEDEWVDECDTSNTNAAVADPKAVVVKHKD